MIIDKDNIDLVFQGSKTVYTEAFEGAPSYVDQVAMRVNSSTAGETYGWMGSFPNICKWVGLHVNTQKKWCLACLSRSDAHSYVNADNEPVAVSNMDTDGDGPKWYLLDTSRMIRPLVWQVRDDYVFQAQDQPSDDHVFLNTEHGDGGASNPWKGTATPIITPFLNSAAA